MQQFHHQIVKSQSTCNNPSRCLWVRTTQGTSAAALRAGVPSVVVPFFGDQPFWGHRLWQLGVSGTPIPKASLSVDKLALAIANAVNHTQMRQKAKVIGEQIQAENGVKQAVKAFHQHFSQPLLNSALN